MRHRSIHRIGLAAALVLGGALTLGAAGAGTRADGDDAPGAPERSTGAVRIAAYNVLNLFDDRDDPALEGRFDDFFRRDQGVRAKPAEQQQAVADAIRAIDADVLALQEIESYDALIEFRERYLRDAGYDHVASIDVGQERGIEQAVLSRFPITEARVWPHMPLGGVHPELYGDQPNWYAGEPILCRRSPLAVTVEVPAETTGGDPYEMTLFVVHQKSGRHAAYWREKESARFVELVGEMERADPDRNIAVLGDFNALAGDASMQTYFGAGMIDVCDPPSGDRAPGPGFTHESRRTIDFILVNDNLAAEVVPGSAFVHATPVRAEGYDWRTTPTPEGYASDHLPVVVDVRPVERDPGR